MKNLAKNLIVGRHCHADINLYWNKPTPTPSLEKGGEQKPPFVREVSRSDGGFTLAEVLITLAIIGVVAALTMPALIQKHQEQVTVTKLKKFYSTFSQAYLMAVNDNGTFDTWGLGDSEAETNDKGEQVVTQDTLQRIDKFFEIMKPYIKIVHYEKFADSAPGDNDRTGYIFADGMSIVAMYLGSSACAGGQNTICGDFYVKTDGKSSEKNGKWATNSFNFRIYPNRIVPTGSTHWENFDECRYGTNYTRCTAWVIYNGNMDYLHCPDKLGWNKARSCKDK